MNGRSHVDLQFYLTTPHACSYLPGRMARSQVAAPAHQVNTAVYSALLQQGFRRSGAHTYRPHCDVCRACVPVRVPVDEFVPSRTQRRVGKRNSGLQVSLSAPHFDVEHFELYQRYQSARHAVGGMDHDDREQYMEFLVSSHVDTWLLVFRDQGVLRMVSLIDSVADGLSAVYTFFDPDLPTRSLGVYNVMWQIELARSLHLPYLYLGYWVEGSKKMAYKQQYQPLQRRVDGAWKLWETS